MGPVSDTFSDCESFKAAPVQAQNENVKSGNDLGTFSKDIQVTFIPAARFTWSKEKEKIGAF